ncbi:hypothetical protein [Lysobacter niastensis]|uniref:L-alanine exporter AlaE n=1 Tax=Lysobacter niastensis TaxID=380629 RepID=A0ABS0BAL3_9GAMM|nr:hypothetical protein [Lysobacter niastensis]MBF6026035.1 hypothetical protein [Lysobacter niastensis]
MDSIVDVLQRFSHDLYGRLTGPMPFRLVLQPGVALYLAARDGIKDARTGRDPYLWHIVTTDQASRSKAWREGVTAVTRLLILGVVMDVIYQVKVFGGFPYPLEAFVVSFTLAFLPYLLFRGPFARIAKWWMHRHPGAKSP